MNSIKCFIAAFFLSIAGFAQPYLGHDIPDVDDPRAAGCSPANGSYYLEFNNVKALIHTGQEECLNNISSFDRSRSASKKPHKISVFQDAKSKL